MTVEQFIEWFWENRDLFGVTTSGEIRSHKGLCPLQVFTGFRSGYVRVIEQEFNMPAQHRSWLMAAADTAFPQTEEAKAIRKQMLDAMEVP
jgi:sirohydrochlorin ferrochelatase